MGNRNAGVSTDRLMRIALELTGATTMPGDSAVQVPGDGLRRVMMGVDIGAAELLLAKHLAVDGVIAHHPAGGAAELNFAKVLNRGVELMTEAGVALADALATIQPAVARALLRAQAANHDHVPSVARLLALPLLNVHLPLDEVGRRVMVEAIEMHLAGLGREAMVEDVAAGLRTIPEIRDAPTRIMVPVGRLDNPAGRVCVYHGAGTNGGFAVARTLFAAGVGTVVYIHLAPDEADRIRGLDAPGNVIVAGHIACDLIGINRYLAAVEAEGVEVVRMSGL